MLPTESRSFGQARFSGEDF